MGMGMGMGMGMVGSWFVFYQVKSLTSSGPLT